MTAAKKTEVKRVAVLMVGAQEVLKLELKCDEWPPVIKHGPNLFITSIASPFTPAAGTSELRYDAIALWDGDSSKPVSEVFDGEDMQIARIQALQLLDAKAQALFTAYNNQPPNPWKTHDGKDVPKWPELNDQVRAKWKAVALVTL